MTSPVTSSVPATHDFSSLVRSEPATEVTEGTVVLQEGEPGDCLFVLLEGTVSVSVSGRELYRLGPGTLFGEMAVISGEPRSATVTALSPLRLVPITRKRFLFLTEQTPFFALHMMQLLSARLRQMNQHT